MRLFVYVSILLFVPMASVIAEPDSIKVNKFGTNTLVPLLFVGSAKQLQLAKPIYIAALFSANSSSIFQPNNAMAMELHVITDNLSYKTLAGIWQDRIIINFHNEFTNQQGRDISEFIDLLEKGVVNDQAKLVSGDHLRFMYLPGNGTTITLNQTKVGFFSGDVLFPLLLASWVGRVPPSSDFKAEINGEYKKTDEYPKALFAEYDALKPLKKRVNEVAKAVNVKRQQVPVVKRVASRAASKPLTRLVFNAATSPSRILDRPDVVVKPVSSGEGSTSETELSSILSKQKEAFKKRQSELRKAHQFKVEQFIKKYNKYPRNAIKKGITGEVLFTVTSFRNGEFTYFINPGSNSNMLDNAAKKTLKNARERLMKDKIQLSFPAELQGESYTFPLLMSYVIK